MRWFTPISLILVLGPTARAQAPDTQWTRIYYESGPDGGFSIKEAKNGYVIAGANWIEAQENYDIYILKINLNGDTLWSRLYGGPAYDVAQDIDVTGDYGFILTGEAQPGGLFLLRTDLNGDSLWMHSYTGTFGESVIETSDGGYVAVGKSGYNIVVVKADYNGNEIWHRIYGHEFINSLAYSVCETSDGHYMVLGSAQYPPPRGLQAWLLKLNQNGDTLWTNNYGGSEWEEGRCVEETSDGGYIITGRTTSYGAGFWDVYLVKTDINGNLQWHRSYGGSEEDAGHSVQQTGTGGYFVGGYTFSYSTYVDFYFIETDQQGILQWSKIVGDSPNSEWGLSSIIASGGSYIMVGNIWISDITGEDIYVVKLYPTTVGIPQTGEINLPDSPFLQNNYPNPFNSSSVIEYSLSRAAHVRIDIYDLLGRKVKTLVDERKQPGTHSITFDASDLSSGVYFYRLQAGEVTETRKMVLLN